MKITRTVVVSIAASLVAIGVSAADEYVFRYRKSVSAPPEAKAPDPFSIPPELNKDPASIVTSAPVTPTGLTAMTAVSASGGAKVSVNGGAFASTAAIPPGGSFVVQTTTPAAFGESVSYTVAVGPETAIWNVSTREQDTLPNPFTIPPLTDQPLNTLVSSASVKPTGFDGPVAISVDGGGEISINDGAWISSGLLYTGDSFRVRMTSSEMHDTQKTVNVTVGSAAPVPFTVRTAILDVIPDDFSWTTATKVPRSTMIESEPVIPVGYEAPTTVVAKSGEFSIDGGPWITSGMIAPGQSIRARIMSSSEYNSKVHAIMSLGGVAKGSFTVHTRDGTEVDPFTIPPVYDAEPNTVVLSEPITPTGLFELPRPVQVLGGSVYVDGKMRVAFEVAPGQSFQAGMTAPNSYNSSKSVTVKVGNRQAYFTVYTRRPPDTTPDPFTIPSIYDVEPNAIVFTEPITPTGFEVPIPVEVANGLVYVDGQVRSVFKVEPGQSFQIRVQAPNGYDKSQNVKVTIGNQQTTFTVHTKKKSS
jgi:hypothetical protein